MDPSNVNPDPFPNLSSEIISIVDAAWDKTNSPIVLAKVGTVLSSEAKSELEKAGRKLKPYILAHMTDHIRYVGSPKYGDFAAPFNATQNLSDEELVHRYEKSRAMIGAVNSGTRFKRDIWNGFTITPEAGRRFICFDDKQNIEVKFNTDGVNSEGQCYEILPSDLAFDEQGNRVTFERVGQLILEWARRNAIEPSMLHPARDGSLDRLELRKIVNQDKEDFKERQVIDNLISVMNILSKDELSRISVPADIVFKLVSFARKHS